MHFSQMLWAQILSGDKATAVFKYSTKSNTVELPDSDTDSSWLTFTLWGNQSTQTVENVQSKNCTQTVCRSSQRGVRHRERGSVHTRASGKGLKRTTSRVCVCVCELQVCSGAESLYSGERSLRFFLWSQMSSNWIQFASSEKQVTAELTENMFWFSWSLRLKLQLDKFTYVTEPLLLHQLMDS